MTVDLEKILLGMMPVIAAILTALWTLRGKQSDNISSDQAAFRKDLMAQLKETKDECADWQAKAIAFELENAGLKRDLEDCRESALP